MHCKVFGYLLFPCPCSGLAELVISSVSFWVIFSRFYSYLSAQKSFLSMASRSRLYSFFSDLVDGHCLVALNLLNFRAINDVMFIGNW
jgi:hypothetical protein